MDTTKRLIMLFTTGLMLHACAEKTITTQPQDTQQDTFEDVVFNDTSPASVCGDGICSQNETSMSCPLDCQSTCGDGLCNGGEDTVNCVSDCGTSCGDTACNGMETSVTCVPDCGSICGDSACNGAESSATCSDDCGALCGDGQCNGDEDTVTCSDDCGTFCGDGDCAPSEVDAPCPVDCGATCGDGTCSVGENTVNCPGDCGSACGDGSCNGTETTANCANDCGVFCGDDVCNGDESTQTCVPDCDSSCGDGTCNGAESSQECVVDCGDQCGDGVCNGNESASQGSCAADCGVLCGNGICEPGEKTTNCSEDCGTKCGDGTCNDMESTQTCVPDCGAECGDDTCNGDETSSSCPNDCGSTCGDGACNGEESTQTCVPDCGTKCGDGACNGDESSSSCHTDCGTFCGDDQCNGAENTTNCLADCGSTCGDGACNGEESTQTCVPDCGTKCGDGACNGEESSSSCPTDCGTQCGDGQCNGEESSFSCPTDCGSVCGNGNCEGAENTTNCTDDCGTECGDGACNGTENTLGCVTDCGTQCGDGQCNGEETISNCPSDCNTSLVSEISGDCNPPPLSAPSVGLDGNSLADDSGPYLGLGASLFWAAWGYKNDLQRLKNNLQFLSDNGFNYIRALGVVGCVNDPNSPSDYWIDREIKMSWPDYDQVIAEVTDLAYDQYGLRIEWTLIGDGQCTVPSYAEKKELVDRFLAMSIGREHKIVHFELANEAWQNGFEGDEGLNELRELSAYLKSKTDILVAASAPLGHECADNLAVYEGCVADIATIHFDRDLDYAEGPWRPVRQPWEHQYCPLPPGSNNEPIGPGASVASEEDPLKLVTAAMVTYISTLPMYVYHTHAGVRGDYDIQQEAGSSAFALIHQLLPPDLASWSPVNAHWSNAPFTVYATDQSGTMYPDDMWVDLNDPVSGVVRAYGALSGNDFLVLPIGILNSVVMEARQSMDFAVLNPITGAVLQCHSLAQGQQFTLTGMEAALIKGSFWCGNSPCEPSSCTVSGPVNQCNGTCGPGFQCTNGQCIKECGNGLCKAGVEDCKSCPADCSCETGTSCNDTGQCVKSQTMGCGDNNCAPGIEDCGNCPDDCPCPGGTQCEANQCIAQPQCGDGSCAPGIEDCGNCPDDCPCPGGTQCESNQCIAQPQCGDGSCEPGVEDCGNCPDDCPCWKAGTACNDQGQCVNENVPECGNGQCKPGVEDCKSCPGDCPCPNGKSCNNTGQCA